MNERMNGIELEVDQLQMADPTNHTDLADLANPTNLAHLADPAHPAHPLRALAADSTLSSAVSAREQRLAQRRREREARRPESSMGETPPPSLCSHSLPSTSCNSYCPSRIQTGNEPEVFSPEQLQVRSRRTPTPPPPLEPREEAPPHPYPPPPLNAPLPRRGPEMIPDMLYPRCPKHCP